MSTESCKAGDDFIVALLNVFSCINSVPKALTLVLKPYLDQAHLWTQLHTLAGKFKDRYCDTILYFKAMFLFLCVQPDKLTFTDYNERKEYYFSTYTNVSSHSKRLLPINNTVNFRSCLILQV